MSSVAPKVEEVDAIVVCSDLANFYSSASTKMSPQELVESLNRYLEIVRRTVEDSGGEILIYVGDAMIATWPRPQTEGEKAKIGAALVCLLETVSRCGFPHDIACTPRIGVAAGIVIRSDMAIKGRPYSTELISPAVNLAKRLNSDCKQFKTTILFLENLPVIWPKSFSVNKINEIAIKGNPDENHTVFTLRQAGG
jgi:adenylate cyclase